MPCCPRNPKVTYESFQINEVVNTYMETLPKGAWPNFNLGNHDKSRIASRVGHNVLDAMNMIYMLLPGTPITYYGEELGMLDGSVPAASQDARLNYRTPMLWDNSTNAGFTSGTPWLPVNSNSTHVNVATLQAAKHSHLEVYMGLSHIRRDKSILYGDMETYFDDNVFAYNRIKKGNPGYVVAVNLGDVEVHANVTGSFK